MGNFKAKMLIMYFIACIFAFNNCAYSLLYACTYAINNCKHKYLIKKHIYHDYIEIQFY